MNVLLETFPTKISIFDKEYEINSDFRDCLAIILAFEDEELTVEEKIQVLINNLYKEEISNSNFEEAYKQGVKFLDCGEDKKMVDSAEENEEEPKLYSFSKDAKYIYSAIKQTHRIDLETIEYMHWWKFVYLFLDLDKECFFSQMIYLRSQKTKGKLTKEEALQYWKMRDILDLDYGVEMQEKSEFEILLEGE